MGFRSVLHIHPQFVNLIKKTNFYKYFLKLEFVSKKHLYLTIKLKAIL